MKLKNITINLLIVFLSFLALLFFCELILRLFFVNNVNLFPRYHSEVEYEPYKIRRLRPNTEFYHTSVDGHWKFQINNQGYRNSFDFNIQKDSNEVRIITLGDSHTEGFEVHQNETYSSIITGELEQQKINANTYNMGVSGFGTDEQLITLKYFALKYKPDYVVVGFFANDYEDNLKTKLFTVLHDSLTPVGYENLPGVKILDRLNSFYLIRKLSEYSYLYSVALNTVWDYFKTLKAKEAKNQNKSNDSVVNSYAIATQTTLSGDQILLTNLLIDEVIEVCHDRKIKTIFIDIPQLGLKSSMDSSTYDRIKTKADYCISVQDIYNSSDNGDLLAHVPHGQRHISSETHKRIGIKVANWISSQIQASTP